MRPPPGSGLRASLVRIVRGVLESLGCIHCSRRVQQQGSSSVQSGGGQEPDDTKAKGGSSISISNRSLPLSTFIQMLGDKTGRHDVGVGSIRTTLFHHFGDEASPKVKRFMKVMVGKLRHDGKEAEEQPRAPREAEAEAEAEAPAQDAHSVEEVYAGPPPAARLRPRNGVLISGCQTDETSADATTADGMSYGALSNAIQTILAGNGKKRGVAVSNRELVVRARELLSKQGYTQQPGLYCSDEHATLPFIC